MQKTLILAATAMLVLPAAHAAAPEELMRGYAEQARRESASYAPSAAKGRQFFMTRHGHWSCSSCHGVDPATAGRHAVTGKPIAPMAPAADPRRFRDAKHVDKWFKRNCNDTLDRPCTAAEKADVVAYLLTIRTGGA